MPIVITPEVGIPLPFDTTPQELSEFRQKANAYFNTMQELLKNGGQATVTDEDKHASHKIFAESRMPPVRELTPGTIINLESILSEWDQEVIDVSRRLRNYVTNKLIEDSTLPDPKHRLKALEMLGRISSVGLFSDKVEVNVTHRSLSDIESELKKTLAIYMGDAERVDKAKPISLEELDYDAELGIVSEDE
jgi:hypothetical protein